MNEYDMAEVQKQWYDRDGWPLDLNAVYAINEFKGDSSDMADVQKWYLDGGPGSGNWGHQGRPGIKGGSGPGGGVAYRLNTPSGGYTGLVGAYKENEAWNKANGKTEPKKNEEPVKEKSQFAKALESGYVTASDVAKSEIGDTVNFGTNDSYVKISDDRWVCLQTGLSLKQSDIEMTAQHSPSSLRTGNMTITSGNKELDDATKGLKDTDDIHSIVNSKMKEMPVGTMYVSDDGVAYVKVATGKWKYSKEASDVSDETASFDIANECAKRAGVDEKSMFRYGAEKSKIAYNEPKKLSSVKSDEDIIQQLAGPDQTTGSCASLAFSYAGQKAGIDVTDYRGGESQYYFSRTRSTLIKMGDAIGAKSASAKSDIASAKSLLNDMPEGQEHILMAGSHAAVVKKEGKKLFYLEMQSNSSRNGWQEFKGTTLSERFGCKRSHRSKYFGAWEKPSLLINVDTLGKNKEFQKTLGYINTATDKQKKGAGGYAK